MITNPVPWPQGARCAVVFTCDMDADSILHLAHHASADTRVAALSMLRYGPEVAEPRLVDLYARFGMRQTFFLPACWIERYPAAVETILNGGHEIAHHGYLHEHPNALDMPPKSPSQAMEGYQAEFSELNARYGDDDAHLWQAGIPAPIYGPAGGSYGDDFACIDEMVLCSPVLALAALKTCG